MLSAWRKFTRKQDDKPVFPAGVVPVDQTMQKKFAKGVQYNLKIIIKGDRNTGKSTLLRRLSGSSFKEEYIPTHEIQVSNINWNYRGACDIVKVEVWDIVDKSHKKRTPSGSLKITNTEEMKPEENEEGLALDAELINVYQGTHGVILTMDITKAWTWQYTQRELDKIPNHIPVLVLANFRDMGDRRVVQSDEIEAYLKHYDRPTGAAELYFSEASMKDGFGLRFIYKFLNMPFLILQRETLLKQLEANALEIEDMREALSIDFSSEEQNYDLFHEIRLKRVEPNLFASPAVDSQEKQERNQQEREEESCPPTETSEPQNTGKTVKQLPIATVPPTIVEKKTTENSREERQTETIQEKPKLSRFQEYKAKLFGAEKVTTSEPERPEVLEDQEDVVPIDEFHPGSLDDNFLNSNTVKSQHLSSSKAIDSDSDDDGNPMVAGYEDLESEDDNDSEGIFQQQLSNEAEFDDLSEDEKPRMEESEMSIIDQIKKRKKLEDLESTNDVATSDYHVLSDNADVSESYDELDTDLNNELGKYEKHPTQNTAAELNNHELQTNKQITKKIEIQHNKERLNIDNKYETEVDHSGASSDSLVHQESDSDQKQDNKEYVIAADVDINDDWIEDNRDDGTKNEVDSSQSDIKVADGAEPEGTENSTGNRKDTTISFNLDDLEMFMNSQMEKVESSKEPEKPREQKKKKKKKKVQDVETSGEEKHMRKKKSKKVSNTEIELNRETTKKNKKPKTKTPDSLPEKHEKKKKSKSDLDAFLDGF